ncbi:hypothetical protein [Salana multivorans]
MRSTTTSLAASLAVLALVASACSGGAEPAPEWDEMPLRQVFDELNEARYGSHDFVSEEMKVQNLVADCMKELGFDYVPAVDPQDDSMVPDVVDPSLPQWGTEEYHRQYGYGITTWDETPQGQANAEIEAGYAAWVDPNEALVAAMSPQEQDEYWHALGGWLNEEGTAGDPERPGCVAIAQEQVAAQSDAFAELDANPDPAYQESEEAYYGILHRTATDPRVIEADGRWSACMGDAGFPGYGSPDKWSFEETWPGPQEAVNEMFYDTQTDEWGTDLVVEKDLTEAEVAEIRALEIELATADYLCKEEVGWEETRRKVNAELEQEVLDEYSDVIETHRARVLDAAAAAEREKR